ncbi:hypothetical protein BC829DRAFT_354975, partial [Chytridium lagenaria]
YVDDFRAGSPTFDEHLLDLSALFSRIAHHSGTLAMEKLYAFVSRFATLGHIVEEGRYWVHPEKLDVIRKWPTPRSQKELRSFVMTISFFARGVPRFTDHAQPLFAL